MRKLFRRGDRQVKIVPKEDFLEGRVRYEKGKTYMVDAPLARYFDRNGWIEGSDAAIPPKALDVDNGKLGQSGGF